MKRPFLGMYPVTQEWGVNPADYARFGLKGHNGVDYGVPTCTSILAPHNGTVIEAAYDQYGYGMYVKIENDKDGSILGHFQSFNVNAGDTVSEGQQVGISDSTGNSTGPHLHWGYYRMPRNKSDGYSGTTNPFPYLTENNLPQGNGTPPIADESEKDRLIVQLKQEQDRLNKIIEGKDKLIEGLNIEHKSLSDKLLECQSTVQSSSELQDKLNNLTAKYKKLLKTPSKAQIDLLIKICSKLEIII